MKRTTLRAAALAASLATTTAILTSCSSDDDPSAPPSETTAVAQAVLEPGETNPMIAQGVTISSGARVYKSSGLGPTAANTAAPQGTPESYIDSQFTDGELPDGVTVTEAQGINVLKNIRANLEAQGLTLADVTTMRVFLDNAPGTDRADYAGWNRAYRQFFANTNLDTGDTELVPLGSAEPAAPLERNASRPTRFALEVGSLPIPGWLVEVEVDAVYPTDGMAG